MGFCIFNTPNLEEYVSYVERGAHLLQSCFLVAHDNFPLVAREIQVSFESLVVIDSPSVQAFFMDIHHDTFHRSILEDNSISSIFKTHIHFVRTRGLNPWLIVMPSICLFHIAHFIFTSVVRFCFGLI
jgi:hypothetical protein